PAAQVRHEGCSLLSAWGTRRRVLRKPPHRGPRSAATARTGGLALSQGTHRQLLRIRTFIRTAGSDRTLITGGGSRSRTNSAVGPTGIRRLHQRHAGNAAERGNALPDRLDVAPTGHVTAE